MDIGSLAANFQERRRESDQRIREVANAMDGCLVENNQRSNNQDSSPKELSDAIVGLRDEMEESSNDAQQIQENKGN